MTALVAALMFGVFSWKQASAGAEDPRKGPLGELWGRLLQPNANCVVSFTNPAFVWAMTPRSRVYMTYHGPLSAPVGASVDSPYVEPELTKEGGKGRSVVVRGVRPLQLAGLGKGDVDAVAACSDARRTHVHQR